MPFPIQAMIGRSILVLTLMFVGALLVPAQPPVTPTASAPASGPGKPLTLIHKLTGHEELVYAAAFSPDGKLLATGSFDKSVRLWDAATGKLIKTFSGPTGHQNLVLSVAFSTDGKQIASCGSDNTIKFWDVPTTEAVRQFVGHEAGIVAMALSPNGAKLATAAGDKSIRLWEAATGKLLLSCQGSTAGVKSLAFSSNSEQLLCVGADQTLRVWNVADGQPIAAADAHAAPISKVLAASAGNAALTAGQDGLIRLWQMPLGSSRLLNPPHEAAITALALLGDGARLVSTSADKTVRVSAVATATQERILSGPNAPVTSLAVAGTTAAAATADHHVFLWNAVEGKPLGQLPPSSTPISSLALQPQGREILVGLANGEIRTRSLPLEQERTLAHPDVVLAIALAPSGDRLFTATSDRLVRGWNLATQQSDQQYAGLTTPATALLFGDKLVAGSTDGELLVWAPGQGQPAVRWGAHAASVTALLAQPGSPDLISTSLDGSVKRWKPPTPPRTFANPANVTAAALSADGTRLMTGCADNQVRVWNLATGQAERSFTGPTQPITDVAFSWDGAKLAFLSADQSLRVHQASDGKELLKIDKLPTAPGGLAFSPKGDLLAVGAADGKILLVQLTDGKTTKELAGHVGTVSRLRFLPSGERLVSQGVDNTLQVWTIADGKSVVKIPHPPGLTTVTISDDGRSLVSGATDQKVRFWNVADGKAAGELTVAGDVRAVALRKDGLRLLIGTADGRSLVYDRDGNLLEYGRQPGAVGFVAFAADGQNWLSAGADKNAQLFTPSLVWSSRFAGGIRSAVWLPTAKQIAVAGDDKSIKFLRPSDGVAVRIYSGHQAPVNELALNKDGTKLASASADLKVWIWNVAENRPEKTYAATAAVTGLGFSADGKALLIASGPVVKRIDPASGKEEAPLATLAAPVLRMLITEDAKSKQPLALAATADKNVRWVGTMQSQVIAAHQGAVTSIAYHPNGTQALTGGVDKAVKLWDLATGKEVRAFAGASDAVSAVAFSREATPTRVAAASADKSVRIWNLTDAKEILKLTHPSPVRSIAFSPDHSKLVTATDAGRVTTFDAVTGQELQYFQQQGAVNAAIFSADGRTIVFGGAEKTVTLAPAAVMKVLATNPTSAITDIALIPGGTQLAAACADGTVQIFNLATGKLERTVKCPGPVQALAVHKAGATLFTAGADKAIRAWNLADSKELKAIPVPAPVSHLTVSPSGGVLLAACGDNTALALNVQHTPGQPLSPDFGKALGVFAHAGSVSASAFQADSSGFFTAGADKVIKAWRFAQDAPARNIAGHANIVDALAYSPDKQTLASVSHDGTVRFWKTADGASTGTVQAYSAPIYCLAFSKDGKLLLVGSFARSAKLIDVEKKVVVREFGDLAERAFPLGPYDGPFAGPLNRAFPTGHHDGVYSVAFTPDELAVLTTGSDGQILVWNLDGTLARAIHDPALATQGPRPEFRAHRDWINQLRFTPDGSRLISVGQGGWLKVWNFADGKLIYQQKLPTGLYSVVTTPDGQLLATANYDGTAFILKMP